VKCKGLFCCSSLLTALPLIFDSPLVYDSKSDLNELSKETQMKSTVFITSLLLCFSTFSSAQAPVDFSGNWDVKWQENNLQLGAKLSIQNETGTWQMFAQTRRNPCFAMVAPIELKRTTEKRATVTLKYSAALNGCTDGMVFITQIDANSMVGKRGGIDLTFTRN
jgi:hypothetical protein